MLEASTIKDYKTKKFEVLKLIDKFFNRQQEFGTLESQYNDMINYLETRPTDYFRHGEDGRQKQIEEQYLKIEQARTRILGTIEQDLKNAEDDLIKLFYEVVLDQYKKSIPQEEYLIFLDHKKILNFNLVKRQKFVDMLLYELRI